MMKMLIVLLSITFTVAACNKNNSKADRAKKVPGAQQQTPTGQPDGNNKTQPTPDADKAGDKDKDGSKGGSKGAGGSPDASNSDVPPALTVTPKPKNETTKPADGTRVNPAPAAGGTETKDSGPVADVVVKSADVKEKPADNEKNKIEKQEFPTMNHTIVKLDTSTGTNQMHINALLRKDREEAVRTVMYCYDQTKKNLKRDIKVPELYMLPETEMLVEIGSMNKTTEDLAANAKAEENLTTKFVMAMCKGTPISVMENETHEVIRLQANKSQTEYLRLEQGTVNASTKAVTERDMIEVSILCSHESNINAKMDRQKDDSKKLVTNRITLSAGSKLMFARPTNYRNKEGKTLKEVNKFKDYVIISCE